LNRLTFFSTALIFSRKFCREVHFIWLYHHSEIHSFTVSLGEPNYEALRKGFAVPLSSIATPELTRAAVGALRLIDGDLQMMFDARYANMFNKVPDGD
jgi:hypothetical protein